jgi:hypothetical protein
MPANGVDGMSQALVATARCLAVDASTAQVVRAWSAAGVEAILLKGPALAAWLYDDGRARSYGDADLLVGPDAIDTARAVLGDLGYTELPPPEPGMSSHARPWRRAEDGSMVDLHHTLFGASAPPERVWRELAARRVTMPVGGAGIAVLDLPARALMVALHAGQHQRLVTGKPREDLRRALARTPQPAWQEAAALADRLGAVPRLAAGLALEPAGRDLAMRLPLTRASMGTGHSLDTLAVGLERVASANGVRAKADVLARTAIPTPSTMRWWSALARRGRAGLAAAYVLRLGRLVVQSGPAAVGWWRARTR